MLQPDHHFSCRHILRHHIEKILSIDTSSIGWSLGFVLMRIYRFAWIRSHFFIYLESENETVKNWIYETIFFFENVVAAY